MRSWVAAIVVAMLATFCAPAGGAVAADGGDRASAKRVLIEQGMPARLATTVASNARLSFEVRGGRVYVAAGAEAATDLAVASSVIIGAVEGSDYWYGAAINSLGALKTVVYIRYSWSWMWYLNQHMVTIQALAYSMCTWIPNSQIAGMCGTIVTAYFAYTKSKISQGLQAKLA